MAKSEKEYFLTVKHIASDEIEASYYDLGEKFYPEKDEDEYVKHIDIGVADVDGNPVEIDKVIELLQAYKKKGANYVSVDYHEDHEACMFSAFKVYQSNAKEILAEKAKAEKYNSKRNRIDELQKEIDKIRKEQA